MNMRTFHLGPLETNCYLLYDEKQAVVIDPGGPAQAVLTFLDENALKLSDILLTHLHFDHTYGVHELSKASGARVLASEKDAFMLEGEIGLGGMWGMPPVAPYTFTQADAGALRLDRFTCDVLATPGHSPGGLSFYFKEIASVFVGDTLFYRSVGRTDLPGGEQAVLLASIRKQLFSLPEDTRVYPGHGPASTIGDEKKNNPYAGDFIR